LRKVFGLEVQKSITFLSILFLNFKYSVFTDPAVGRDEKENNTIKNTLKLYLPISLYVKFPECLEDERRNIECRGTQFKYL
jgi:hypothetical protein